jgi:PAS domain S-box-containing protein
MKTATRPGHGIAAMPVEEITRLGQIAARIGAVRGLNELAEACVDVLARLGGYTTDGLYLKDLDDGALRLLAAPGLGDDERARAEATAGQRHPGFVLRTGQPLLVRDALFDAGDDDGREGRRAVVRSRMVLPVSWRGEVFGAFGLASTQPDAFDDHDRAVLSFVCELAATTYERLRAERSAQVERERTLQTERESARLHFASLLRAVPDAVVGMTAEGHIAYWNAGAERLLGWREDEVLGRELGMIMPVRHRAAHAAGLARHVATGEARVVGRPVELHGLHREGHEVPVELVISRVEERHATFFLAILRDISTRVAESTARARDDADARRFTAALLELGRSADDDLGAFLQRATEIVARTLGVARASVWRWIDDDLVCDDLYEDGAGRHSDGLRLPQATFPAYFAALQTDEAIVAVDAHTHPATSCFSATYLAPLGIQSMLDAPLRSLAGIRGVICCEATERRAWRELEIRFAADVAGFVVQAFERVTRRDVERRQAAVLGSVGEAVIAVDAGLRVTLMNPVGESLTGVPASEATGRALTEIVRLAGEDGRPLVEEIAAQVLVQGAIERGRGALVLTGADGEIPVSVTAAPMLGDDGRRGVVLSLRDVRADVAARRELVAQQDRLATILSVQQIVARASSRFLAGRSPDPGEIVAEALAALGAHTVAWRLFVARFSPGDGDSRPTVMHAWEWCRDGSAAEDAGSRARAADDVVAQAEALARGRSTTTTSGGASPLLLVPMRVDGQLRGALGVEGAALPSLPDEDVVRLFELVADALVAGLQRLEDERELHALTHALRRLNETLEQRVDERTADLRVSEERFEMLFQNAPQAMLIADASGRVLQSNRGAQAMFGYDDDAFRGLPIAELIPVPLRAAHDENVRSFGTAPGMRARAMAAGRSVSGRRRDGEVFPAEVGLVPLVVRGEPQVLAGVTDVGARVAAQEAVSRSLREKEVLLKEIHHRVKNNLQIISSLLMMQSEQLGSEDARRTLHESVYRVRSMALIHQLFYGGESLDRIDLGTYARSLAASLGGVLAPTARVEVVADDVTVSVDLAVPLGLVLNELLTNAFKYGLPADVRSGARSDRTHADVTVSVHHHDGHVALSVFDSGPGLPEGIDVTTAGTLGLQLVRALTRQLRGRLSIERAPRAGLTLRFPIDAS